MRPLLFLGIASIALLVACDKDSFETKPQIKIKSLSTHVLPLQGNLMVYITYTDKEGDLSEGKLYYKPTRLNRRPYSPDYNLDSTVLPKYPKEPQGEIQVNLLWQNLHRSDLENDTINIRFVVRDKADHVSDTITTEKIVILRQ